MSLDALLTTAAFAPLDAVGWLRITGSDRVRWLNGMTTNNIAALTPGEGCYTFFLNAQGRILADATAFLLEDQILLETASPGSLATQLDHFIIMDDVELAVVPPPDRQGILVAGPDALSVVASLGASNSPAAPCSPTPAPLPEGIHLKQTTYAGAPVWLIRAHSPLVPHFEIWSDQSTTAAILDELRVTQAVPAFPADLHALRVLSGTPLYGTDIRNTDTAKDLPQETGQARALHFAKGCYLGQEIVERIRSRGAVHRTFSGFLLDGNPPASLPTPLTAGTPQKAVGEITSFTPTPHGNVALGYVRREALTQHESIPAARIQYSGGSAIPASLPFQPESLKRES